LGQGGECEGLSSGVRRLIGIFHGGLSQNLEEGARVGIDPKLIDWRECAIQVDGRGVRLLVLISIRDRFLCSHGPERSEITSPT